MVTADNLNLDVLEHIFGFLSEKDLPSVALVSQSFLAAVIPKLYNTISYRVRQSKGYINGQKMSPFATILVHPYLAVYVQNMDICVVPHIKSLPHPTFMRECRDALQLCKNLINFSCTVTVPNMIAMLLPSLQDKLRLKNVRVHCNISSPPAKMLAKIKNLTNLSLDFASWSVVHILPSWMATLSTTLRILTLYMINDLHEDVLKDALRQLPNLRGLHVIGCPKIDQSAILRHVMHTPLLESLSMTTSGNSPVVDVVHSPPLLRHLKHLALDTRFMMQPTPTPSTFTSILNYIKPSAPPLISFSMKLPERKLVIGDPFISQLVENHAFTLRRLSFLDCIVSKESIETICKSCIHLEQLTVAIPMKEMGLFAQKIALSKTLHTLSDVDSHAEHGVRPSLTRSDASFMMSLSGSLRKIVTSHKIWTGQMESGYVSVSFSEKPHQRSPVPLWFIPSDCGP